QAASRNVVAKVIHRWHGVARCQGGELLPSCGEKRITGHCKSRNALLRDSLKCRVDFNLCAGAHDINLQTHGACSGLRVSHLLLRRWKIGVHQNSDHICLRHQFTQEPEPLSLKHVCVLVHKTFEHDEDHEVIPSPMSFGCEPAHTP